MSTDPAFSPTLFIWQAQNTTFFGYPEVQRSFCRWCGSHLKVTPVKHELYPWTDDTIQQCLFCGWLQRRINYVDEDRYPRGDVYCFRKELREFSVNDKEILLSETDAYLQKHSSHIYALSPRRFEELIEDVFKHWGYRTRLTPATRDDGVDIYLLDKGGHDEAIVEVKRYARERKIGIGIIDRLRGVQLRKGVKHAKLVTSSTFTWCAAAAAYAEPPREMGFTMELIDAGRLLMMLGVYDERLPPLEEAVRKWKPPKEALHRITRRWRRPR